MKSFAPFSSRILTLLGGSSVLILVLSSGGCSAGIVGAVVAFVANDDGSSSGNAATVVGDVAVAEARTSPALITFRLTDQESDPADVRIQFREPGQGRLVDVALLREDEAPADLVAVGRVVSDLSGLATGPDGVTYTVIWDFARQLGEGFRPTVPIEVFAVGGTRAQPAVAAVGNDPPVLLTTAGAAQGQAPEVSGVVPVDFMISDTAEDCVRVRVEFEVLGDDQGWKLARPAEERDTPEFAFPAEPTSASGRRLVFFWDTDVDLPDRDVEARLRFLVQDLEECDEGGKTIAPELVVETGFFQADNDREPIAFLGGASFAASQDRRRGIAIPFEVRDEEGNDVDVIFQWRLAEGRNFPELSDRSRSEIFAAAADPVRRRELQIATPLPIAARGRVSLNGRSRPDVQIRLPEIGTGDAPIAPADMSAQEILILRASKRPAPLEWPGGFLNRPVAALPVEDGVDVLLLDAGSGGGWRLRRVHLASRASTPIASGDGEPTAMTLESGGDSVVLAETSSGTTRLLRVAVSGSDSAPEELLSLPAPPVNSLVSLGSGSAVATMGDSLVRFYFTEERGTHAVLIDGLNRPCDVAVDPGTPSRVYVAEKAGGSGGRILVVDIETRVASPLFGGEGLPAPEALALVRAGSRLLVVTDEGGDGRRELREVFLGRQLSNAIRVVTSDLPGRVSAVAVGAEGLQVLTLSEANDLAVGGGIVQKREIAEENGYDARTHVATVTEPFVPELQAGDLWKILVRPRTLRTPASLDRGTNSSFVWNTGADVPGGGEVFVRVLPFDTERGAGQELDVMRVVRGELDAEPLILGGRDAGGVARTRGAQAVELADLDGDGDLDIVVANRSGHTVEVFLQHGRGEFGALDGDGEVDPGRPDLVFVVDRFDDNDRSRDDGPSAVTIADVDGDGRNDLVTADAEGDSVSIFLQLEPFARNATFDEPHRRIEVLRPVKVAVGDVDGDGKLDLITATEEDRVSRGTVGSLTLFRQEDDVTFGDPVIFGGQNDSKWVAVADLNSDGRLDVVSANDDSAELTLFFQPEQGFRQEAPSNSPIQPDATLGIPDAAARDETRYVVAADFDGDGLTDLASANFRSGSVTIYLQKSPGNFGVSGETGVLPDATLDLAGLGQPAVIRAADLNGDGRLDMITANPAPVRGSVAVFYQGPAGFLNGRERPDLVLVRDAFETPQGVAVADLQGDGKPDIVSANIGSSNLGVFVQLEEATYRLEQESSVVITLGPQSFEPADVDADGRLDLVIADEVDGNASIHFQRAPGVFARVPDVAVGVGAEAAVGESSLVVGHLDGIGLNGESTLDIATGNSFGNNITLFPQNPDGSFDNAPSLVLVAAPSGSAVETPGLASGDVTGDGLADLVSTRRRPGQVRLFSQPATGFPRSPEVAPREPEIILTTPGRPFIVGVADLDRDGSLEIVVTDSSGLTATLATVLFPPFDSGPSRNRALVTPRGIGVGEALAIADVNLDGRLDLVVGNVEDDTIVLFLQSLSNDGFRNGNVETIVLGPFEAMADPVGLAVADLDADGLPDLLSANQRSKNLTLYSQPVSGFSPSRVLGPSMVFGDPSMTNGPRVVRAVDLDGDGDLDITTTAFDASTPPGSLRVFFGNHLR